jgi:hypothetical protein
MANEFPATKEITAEQLKAVEALTRNPTVPVTDLRLILLPGHPESSVLTIEWVIQGMPGSVHMPKPLNEACHILNAAAIADAVLYDRSTRKLQIVFQGGERKT